MTKPTDQRTVESTVKKHVYDEDFAQAVKHVPKEKGTLTAHQHRILLERLTALGYDKLWVLEVPGDGCVFLARSAGRHDLDDAWEFVGNFFSYNYSPPISPEGFNRIIPHLPACNTYNFSHEFLQKVERLSGAPYNTGYKSCRFHFPTRNVDDWWASLKYNSRRDLKKAQESCRHLRTEVVWGDYPLVQMEALLLEYSEYLVNKRQDSMAQLQLHRSNLELMKNTGSPCFLIYDGPILVSFSVGLMFDKKELNFCGAVRRLGSYDALRLGEFALLQVATFCVERGLIFNASSDSVENTPGVFYKYKALPKDKENTARVYEFGSALDVVYGNERIMSRLTPQALAVELSKCPDYVNFPLKLDNRQIRASLLRSEYPLTEEFLLEVERLGSKFGVDVYDGVREYPQVVFADDGDTFLTCGVRRLWGSYFAYGFTVPAHRLKKYAKFKPAPWDKESLLCDASSLDGDLPTIDYAQLEYPADRKSWRSTLSRRRRYDLSRCPTLRAQKITPDEAEVSLNLEGLRTRFPDSFDFAARQVLSGIAFARTRDDFDLFHAYEGGTKVALASVNKQSGNPVGYSYLFNDSTGRHGPSLCAALADFYADSPYAFFNPGLGHDIFEVWLPAHVYKRAVCNSFGKAYLV